MGHGVGAGLPRRCGGRASARATEQPSAQGDLSRPRPAWSQRSSRARRSRRRGRRCAAPQCTRWSTRAGGTRRYPDQWRAEPHAQLPLGQPQPPRRSSLPEATGWGGLGAQRPRGQRGGAPQHNISRAGNCGGELRIRLVYNNKHTPNNKHRKGRCVSDPCAILTVRCSARAARRAPQRTSPRAAAGRAPPSTPCGARSVPHRASTARREGWTADAEHLRGAHLTARPRGRAARAEHLTVSIAHGSLTHRPFLCTR